MLVPLITTTMAGFFIGIPLSFVAQFICTLFDEFIYPMNFSPDNPIGSMVFLGAVMSMILVPSCCWFSRNGNEFSTE